MIDALLVAALRHLLCDQSQPYDRRWLAWVALDDHYRSLGSCMPVQSAPRLSRYA